MAYTFNLYGYKGKNTMQQTALYPIAITVQSQNGIAKNGTCTLTKVQGSSHE